MKVRHYRLWSEVYNSDYKLLAQFTGRGRRLRARAWALIWGLTP